MHPSLWMAITIAKLAFAIAVQFLLTAAPFCLGTDNVSLILLPHIAIITVLKKPRAASCLYHHCCDLSDTDRQPDQQYGYVLQPSSENIYHRKTARFRLGHIYFIRGRYKTAPAKQALMAYALNLVGGGSPADLAVPSTACPALNISGARYLPFMVHAIVVGWVLLSRRAMNRTKFPAGVKSR